MRILVVTTEPLPLPGCMTTGAGLRAWGLVEGLRASGFEVEPAMAEDAVKGFSPTARKEVAPYLFARERLTEHVRERAPDVLVMQHWGLMNRLGRVDCPLAMDLAGPHLLERRYWGSPNPARDLDEKLSALRRADFLTCSGHFQRHYFLGFAALAGFDPAATDLLPVIPFSVSPDLPYVNGHDPLAFVYTGMFLPWQDPRIGIEAVLSVLEKRQKGSLKFVGALHPAGHVPLGDFREILERVGRSPRAAIEDARPFDELQRLLRACGVALDLMSYNPERELAFTSRTVVYLSCGLPVIYNNYSELSGLIAEYEAGWCLDPEDSAGVAALTEHLLDDPVEVEIRRECARRLVRERLTWNRTIVPLAKWCKSPAVREGKDNPFGGESVLDVTRRLGESQEALRELKGRRLVRLSNYLRRFRG